MIGHEPLIEIIIPNWNGKTMLEHCLLSLRQQTYSNFRIIVVDNGSTDGSIELVQRSFPEVLLVPLSHNTGFSIAVNKGIEASRAPWLLLLNNDMEVAEDCLAKLQSALTQYTSFHMFALKMMNYRERGLIDGAGDAVLRGGVGYRLGTMEADSEEYCQDREVFGACAGAALYSREIFDRAGFFDADFFAYLEDVDFNMRSRRLGCRCMYIAGARVYHIGSASTGSKINQLTVRLSTRNNIHVLAKNYSLRLFAGFFPAIFIYQLAWLLFCTKKGLIFPYLAGLYEGLLTLPRFIKKRMVMHSRKDIIPSTVFANMIKTAERSAVHSIMARRTANAKNNFLLNCYCKFFL